MTEKYHVVVEPAYHTRGMGSQRSHHSFADRDEFLKWYKPKKKLLDIVDEGITSNEASRLVSQIHSADIPSHCQRPSETKEYGIDPRKLGRRVNTPFTYPI